MAKRSQEILIFPKLNPRSQYYYLLEEETSEQLDSLLLFVHCGPQISGQAQYLNSGFTDDTMEIFSKCQPSIQTLGLSIIKQLEAKLILSSLSVGPLSCHRVTVCCHGHSDAHCPRNLGVQL